MNQEQADARVKQSKDWRKRLDAILQEMKAQQREEQDYRERHESGRHLALSVTHLEDSIMRQGMRLKEIEATNPETGGNPYPESYNPESRKVEPTADKLKL